LGNDRANQWRKDTDGTIRGDNLDQYFIVICGVFFKNSEKEI
jgi:hypothetical protein